MRHYGGEPAAYIIGMPGKFTIYHAGDTAVFGDMKLIGELYKPVLAMLPIGDRFTMGPRGSCPCYRAARREARYSYALRGRRTAK